MIPPFITNHEDFNRAFEYAREAHGTQMRKYTGDPYIVHPVDVAEIVYNYGGSPDMVMAALLHDVVEDTPRTIQDVSSEFGFGVAVLVSDLTDISVAADGNRAVRKELDRQHTASASDDAKFVKLADLMHNTESIVKHDKHFARTYLQEKSWLMDVLKTGTNTHLWNDVNNQLNHSMFRVLDKH